MDEPQSPADVRGRRGSARDAKRSARAAPAGQSVPYITRKIPVYEVLGEEGLALIERNADTILEEIGIEFREDAEALEVWKKAGADVQGERVRMPRGMCRQLIQASAPREFTQHARNPARNVQIGGPHTVFAPAYGSPFIYNLDEGRRYARIEDFRNFVKLAYQSKSLHHSGGTICEPVDLPVNKRHFDMVYSHMKYSDKCFMGSVTHPERAKDTVEMAKILFGDAWLDPATGKPKTFIVSLINVNSPMTYDATMLGALKVYARANQACIVTPFILAGAMSPVTVAGTATQTLAEALAGMAFMQLLNPGCPMVLGSFASSLSMQSGAPTFGTPEPALVLYIMASLARRLGVPFRSGGSLCAVEDPGRAGGLRVGADAAADLPRRRELRAAHGGLARGRARDGLREIRHGRRPGRDDAHAARGRGPLRERPGARGDPRGRAGQALPRLRAHARELRDRVLPFADRRQQQLRAVGCGRAQGHGGARERALEEAARGVRRAAARPGRGRGAPRLHEPAQGVVPGFERLKRKGAPRGAPFVHQARSGLRSPARSGCRTCAAGP